MTQKILQLGSVPGKGASARSGQELPPPPSRLAAPQGDQGPARRDGCGKARLWLLYHTVQEPKSLLVRKLHPEKKLLVTFLSPPRRRAVRPWVCQGSPPRKAWRSFRWQGGHAAVLRPTPLQQPLLRMGTSATRGKNERELRSARGSQSAASSSPRRSEADLQSEPTDLLCLRSHSFQTD